VELVQGSVSQPLLHVLLHLKGGKHPALLKEIARIVLLSHLGSPCETKGHLSLIVTQRLGLATLQGLLEVQMQSQNKSPCKSEAIVVSHG
jgi:hypothetical protein